MVWTSALAIALAVTPLAGAASPPAPATPDEVAAASPASAWRPFAARDLLVLDLAHGGRVVVALAPDFAPAHVANIRQLAESGWADNTVIERVQDNYVTQWGEPSARALPPGVDPHPPAERDREVAGLAFTPVPFRDAFARRIGVSGAFPVALAGGRAWLTHCYGMVGVGRDLSPDTGSGSELYAVIGQPPRALDRNIALVGRVVAGMDRLSALPRGTDPLGFYHLAGERVPIRRVRLAADSPAAERPVVEWLDPTQPAYARWLHVRANRQDRFFDRPAGAIDLCGAMPPVRVRTGG